MGRQNLRENVYLAVRRRMQEGDIGYDDRLVDQEIAESLGVSRMPVREALLQLKSEGYLEGTSRGFVLRRIAPVDIANIFEVRLLLEPHAAVAACSQVTMRGLGDMTVALQACNKAHEEASAVAFVHAGWHFRKAWVDMTPNPHLVQTIGRLRDLADLARLNALRQTDFRGGSLRRMHDIFAAFQKVDEAAVRSCIEDNLRYCGAAYYAEQEKLLADSPRRV